MAFFSGFFGRGAKLDKSLSDYPTFRMPHAGEGVDLNTEQRTENFAFFKTIKEHRCELIIAKLAEFGVQLPEPHAVKDVPGVSLALHEFSTSTISKVRGIGTICAYDWRKRETTGRDHRLLCFALDIAIYCGECATHPDVGFVWKIDNTEYKGDDRMPTEGNVSLFKVTDIGPGPVQTYFDLLDWGAYSISNNALAVAGKSHAMENSFFFLDELVEGRHG